MSTTNRRERLKGHLGACVWLTGLPASGKTTLAVTLERMLLARGIHTMVLDGDSLRAGLCSDLGFSREDRAENIRRASAVAGLMVSAGLVVLGAFISPEQAMRSAARKTVERLGAPGRFLECYVRCPLSVCEARDPKGLYARARAGELPGLTGIDAPYEVPRNPELVLDTAPEENTPEMLAEWVIARLTEMEILRVW